MKLQSFRIRNFRSVFDTGWVQLSKDNITTLIGQNESGKTVILKALEAFYNLKFDTNDKCMDHPEKNTSTPFPIIECSFISDQLSEILGDSELANLIVDDGRVNIGITQNDSGEIITYIENENVKEFITGIDETGEEVIESDEDNLNKSASTSESMSPEDGGVQDGGEVQDDGGVQDEKLRIKENILTTESKIIENVRNELPEFIVFEENKSVLPDKIFFEKIDDEDQTGSEGIRNLLHAVGLTQKQLISLDNGGVELAELLEKASKDITLMFKYFWKQYFNNSREIVIEIKHDHEREGEETSGKAFLQIIIRNKEKSMLTFKQRSSGLQWFLSFFLYMNSHRSDMKDLLTRLEKEEINEELNENEVEKAANQEKLSDGEIIQKEPLIMLIDEPGSPLHSNAKKDAYKFLEEISSEYQIIFSTHNSEFISIKEAYRILIVEKKEDNFTYVNPFQKVSSSHRDSIQPILEAIGMDLSSSIMLKENTLILEEDSAYYYITSLISLREEEELDFTILPGTGVSNIPPIATILQGWGINYLVFIDKDKPGLRAREKLKKTLYGGSEELTKEHIIFPKDIIGGIENIFSKNEFINLLLPEGLKEDYEVFLKENSEEKVPQDTFINKMVRDKRISKVNLAVEFYLKCKSGDISVSKRTQKQLDTLLNSMRECFETPGD